MERDHNNRIVAIAEHDVREAKRDMGRCSICRFIIRTFDEYRMIDNNTFVHNQCYHKFLRENNSGYSPVIEADHEMDKCVLCNLPVRKYDKYRRGTHGLVHNLCHRIFSKRKPINVVQSK